MSQLSGENILKNQRLKRTWTQEEAAKRMGISRSYYVMVERGRRLPSVQVARKIEMVFGIDWHIWFENMKVKVG